MPVETSWEAAVALAMSGESVVIPARGTALTRLLDFLFGIDDDGRPHVRLDMQRGEVVIGPPTR